MASGRGLTQLRILTVAGLIIGACGIAILWLAGVVFPFYPPPGIIILAVGALFVAAAPWRWVPIVGTLLGAFVFIGFLVSPTGRTNLLGVAGAGVALGQGLQVLGVLTALVAGMCATRANYRQIGR